MEMSILVNVCDNVLIGRLFSARTLAEGCLSGGVFAADFHYQFKIRSYSLLDCQDRFNTFIGLVLGWSLPPGADFPC